MTGCSAPYHHGDLRNALILAAAELIEDSGSLSFTMADAARRAGVSAAAPYRHFKDKDALLEAVCDLAFLGLGSGAETAIAGTSKGSIDRIVALGEHYIDYVVHKPAFYDLMWGDIGTRTFRDDNFKRRAAGFFILQEAVGDYLAEEGMPSQIVVDVTVKLWSMVHGMSGIFMSNKLQRLHPDANVNAMLKSASHTFMAGLKAEQAAAKSD